MVSNFNLGPEVFMPNFTARDELQVSWQYLSTACGRPAADYNISMICSTQSDSQSIGDSWQAFIVDEGSDYMAFAPCYPPDKSRTQWTTQRGCLRNFCYTSNMTVAGNFSRCMNETAKVAIESARKAGKLNETKGPGSIYGRCEYIDYERLKKGIIKGNGVEGNGVEQAKILSIKSIVTAVGIVLFVAGSGVI